MTRLERLVRLAKTSLAGTALLAAAACGDGKVGPTDPLETGSATTTLTAQPPSMLRGDTLYLAANPTVTETGATLGATTITAEGQTFSGTSAKMVPTASGTASTSTAYTKSRGTSTSASATQPYTVIPLTANVTAPANAIASQSYNYTVNCPVGTDTTTLTVAGNRNVKPGNTGVFSYTPPAAGTQNANASCKNNTVEQTTAAPAVTVAPAPVFYTLTGRVVNRLDPNTPVIATTIPINGQNVTTDGQGNFTAQVPADFKFRQGITQGGDTSFMPADNWHFATAVPIIDGRSKSDTLLMLYQRKSDGGFDFGEGHIQIAGNMNVIVERIDPNYTRSPNFDAALLFDTRDIAEDGDNTFTTRNIVSSHYSGTALGCQVTNTVNRDINKAAADTIRKYIAPYATFTWEETTTMKNTVQGTAVNCVNADGGGNNAARYYDAQTGGLLGVLSGVSRAGIAPQPGTKAYSDALGAALHEMFFFAYRKEPSNCNSATVENGINCPQTSPNAYLPTFSAKDLELNKSSFGAIEANKRASELVLIGVIHKASTGQNIGVFYSLNPVNKNK